MSPNVSGIRGFTCTSRHERKLAIIFLLPTIACFIIENISKGRLIFSLRENHFLSRIKFRKGLFLADKKPLLFVPMLNFPT